MTSARAILGKMRDGLTPDADELAFMAQALAQGGLSDAQAGAFAMAVCINGLDETGRLNLTRAMQHSGREMVWNLDGPVLDKHSTGGVGDCVSLILAPALAACGAYVPMLSGRGLGHTGGTLDKLSAIPGYICDIPTERFQSVVGDVGCAIVSASSDIAPADKRLYAIRDVTGTVASRDLIVASILSKKLAAGAGGLVLDIKTGSGAFMASSDDAHDLAQSLVKTARAAGCRTSAMITDMSQPLARNAGNALELAQVMAALTNPDLKTPLIQLTIALAAEALALAGISDGPAQITQALTSGKAAHIFGRMVHALGGPADFVETWQAHLPKAPVDMAIYPIDPGYVTAINTRALGEAVVNLGGGRKTESDTIDLSVGLSHIAQIGDHVDDHAPLLRIHAVSKDQADAIGHVLQKAFVIGPNPPTRPRLIQAVIA